jgi:hypothetical protein
VLSRTHITDAGVDAIVRAMETEDNELRELHLQGTGTSAATEARLLRALFHRNCRIQELHLSALPDRFVGRVVERAMETRASREGLVVLCRVPALPEDVLRHVKRMLVVEE